jgi:hypothetical protein
MGKEGRLAAAVIVGQATAQHDKRKGHSQPNRRYPAPGWLSQSDAAQQGVAQGGSQRVKTHSQPPLPSQVSQTVPRFRFPRICISRNYQSSGNPSSVTKRVPPIVAVLANHANRPMALIQDDANESSVTALAGSVNRPDRQS